MPFRPMTPGGGVIPRQQGPMPMQAPQMQTMMRRPMPPQGQMPMRRPMPPQMMPQGQMQRPMPQGRRPMPPQGQRPMPRPMPQAMNQQGARQALLGLQGMPAGSLRRILGI